MSESEHHHKVKQFVRDYARAQSDCHSAFSSGKEDRANDAIDRMKALERRVIILPECAG